jgi:hypothetical protein
VITRRSVVLLGLLGLFIGSDSEAQSRSRSMAEGPLARRVLSVVAPDTSALSSRAAAVTVEVLPGEYRVIQVPVPAELPRGVPVQFVVRSAVGFKLLGPPQGTLPADRRDVFLVTLSVADGVLAGSQDAGVVEFTAGSMTVTVPLIATVSGVHRADLRFARARIGVVAGERFTVDVIVRNLGNVAETLDVAAVLPSRWRPAVVSPARVSLAPGAQATVSVAGTTPTTIGYGEFVLEATASSDSIRSLAESRIVVDPGQYSMRTGSAPIFGVTTSSVFTGDQSINGAVLTFRGDVGFGTRVDARYVVAPVTTGAGRFGAARAGLIRELGFISLTDDNWSISAGPMAVPTLPLAGFGTFGQGVAASGHRGAITASVGYAQSAQAQVSSGHAPLAGARVDWQRAPETRWSMSASHLRDVQGSRPRELDAVALEFQQGLTRNMTRAGLAYRSSLAGSGIAAEFGARRESDDRGAEVLLAHIPGGSQAFARATDDVLLSGYWGRRGRLPWAGAVYLQRDRSPSSGDVLATGFNIGPRYALRPGTTLDATVRGRTFTNEADRVVSGARELEMVTGLQHQVGSVFLGADASTGVLTQLLRPVDAPNADATVGRSAVRGSIGTSLPFARVSANGVLQWTGDGVGVPTQQRFVAAQISELPVWPFTTVATMHARLATNAVPGEGQGVSSAVVGVTVRLGARLGLVVEAEQNRISAASARRAPWVTYVQLTSDMPVAALRAVRRGHGGSVYQDLNANGARDAGEPGVAGIVMVSGAESAVSDSKGRYSFATALRSDVRIDVRSLPLGFVAPRAAGASGAAQDFGIIPTGALTAQVVLGSDALGRRAERPFDHFVVVATDSLDRAWRALVDGEGTARLDALPPGRYVVRVELARGTEALDLGSATAVVVIDPMTAAKPVSLTVLPRPIRIWVPPQRQGGAGGAGQSGTTGPEKTTRPPTASEPARDAVGRGDS